jgi:hypothetical protein
LYGLKELSSVSNPKEIGKHDVVFHATVGRRRLRVTAVI